MACEGGQEARGCGGVWQVRSYLWERSRASAAVVMVTSRSAECHRHPLQGSCLCGADPLPRPPNKGVPGTFPQVSPPQVSPLQVNPLQVCPLQAWHAPARAPSSRSQGHRCRGLGSASGRRQGGAQKFRDLGGLVLFVCGRQDWTRSRRPRGHLGDPR